MNLEQLLGEDLYKQVAAKIDEANEGKESTERIRFMDLSEGGYVSKAKYDRVESEKGTLQEQFDAQAQMVKDLQKDNKDNEALQQRIQQLNDDLKASQKKEADIQKTYALKEALSKEGCLDPDYLIYKQGGLENFTFDKDGSPIGVSDVLGKYKGDSTMAHLFRVESPAGYNPKDGQGSDVKNPFAKETFNLTEQTRLFQENPEQARALAAEAGLKFQGGN